MPKKTDKNYEITSNDFNLGVIDGDSGSINLANFKFDDGTIDPDYEIKQILAKIEQRLARIEQALEKPKTKVPKFSS